MRRFWLLLLAFVLPLQMSWAAVHFCDDDLKAATTVAASQAAADQHDHAQAESAAKKNAGALQGDALADACCGAAHGCHGLHNLMGQAEPLVLSIQDASVLIAADTRQAQRFFSTRHERPQWLAA